jgi:hypothetical protein
MNVTTFLTHYGISENPFRAEEAAQDVVFERIESECRHPDFEKICGDFRRPSSSIVFGERGSGKTAIRMQIEHEIEVYNLINPSARCLVVAYDDLNPVLDHFASTVGRGSPNAALKEFRLTDHMDAMLASVVPAMVDQLLGTLRGRREPLVLDGDLHKRLRQLDPATKRDLLMLQLCYDQPGAAADRTMALKKALRYRSNNLVSERKWATIVLGALTLIALGAFLVVNPETNRLLWGSGLAALFLITVFLGARFLWSWTTTQRLANGLHRSLRILHRPVASFRRSLLAFRTEETEAADLPCGSGDEPRYAMFARLKNVIRPFGYESVVILVDRIDEPTMVRGEPARMQALVWPLLNNKFLQQTDLGIKLLLPVELRYQLNREGGDFFREARLDKQNLVDRLSWSGATLYDLCTARLNACRSEEREDPVSIMDFFDESVTHQHVVDALDQMQQPRDAFKFLYQLLQEHCSNVPEEAPVWKIAGETLDSVRKLQAQRLAAMLRGAQPA